MRWSVKQKKEMDLIILRVTGEVVRETFASLLEDLYTGFSWRHGLLDLSEASLLKIGEDDITFWIKNTQEVKKHCLPNRVENAGRAAIFAPQDLNFGVARIWQTLVKYHRYPIAFEVFRTENEAVEWLLSSGDVTGDTPFFRVSDHWVSELCPVSNS